MNSFSVRAEAVLILVPASNRFDAREEAVCYFLSLVGYGGDIQNVISGLWAIWGAHALERGGKQSCERRTMSN